MGPRDLKAMQLYRTVGTEYVDEAVPAIRHWVSGRKEAGLRGYLFKALYSIGRGHEPTVGIGCVEDVHSASDCAPEGAHILHLVVDHLSSL